MKWIVAHLVSVHMMRVWVTGSVSAMKATQETRVMQVSSLVLIFFKPRKPSLLETKDSIQPRLIFLSCLAKTLIQQTLRISPHHE